ncbi:sigma-70 family RNA polymerase sigma factor [Acidomonas methanolica]|nr:sigma-70 family RNA polymerase sigma factor [Acidomonas methanolica]
MVGSRVGSREATGCPGTLISPEEWREWRRMENERERYADASDEDLLRQSGRGDRHAFDVIVVRHGPYALRTAFRLTGHAETAEDLVQEAFVRAWKNASRFDGSRALFTTWLNRVIVNLSIDHKRQRHLDQLSEDFDMTDNAPSAESLLASEDEKRALVDALLALPLRQRAAIGMVYDEGLSGAEAARRMGMSAKAMERLLARARQLMRQKLQESQ